MCTYEGGRAEPKWKKWYFKKSRKKRFNLRKRKRPEGLKVQEVL